MNWFKKYINNWPLYIFFFCWYSILFLYSRNYIKLSFRVVLAPLLVSTLLCFLLLGIIGLIFRDFKKSGIFVGVLVLITFMYGPLHQLLYFNSFNVGIILVKWDFVYLFFCLVVLVISIIILLKTKRAFVRLYEILNIGGLILMFLVIIPLVFNYTKIHFLSESVQEQTQDSSDSDLKNSDKEVAFKPDIYYIIPDDYGAPEVLKNYYGYDDSELTNFLLDKGFYIADKSKTNYPFTTFMIASALNMNYLNNKTLPKIKTQPGGTVIENAIQDSKVLHFIKSQGYSYFHIGSWYDPIRYNNLADVNFVYDNKLNLNEFSNTLLHNTIFYPLVLRFFGLSGRANQIANTLYQYQALSQMPSRISPKFVFVDILSPHTPWVFDKNCKVVRHTPQELKVNEFLDQLTCTNKNLIITIDTILKNSPTPPIIILQTDEGGKDEGSQALKYPNTKGVKGGFEDSSLETNLERTQILSAFYLPGNHKGSLYQTITPVNTFRVVFNEYFDAKLPILPDKIYTFDDYDKLYKFIFNDITVSF